MSIPHYNFDDSWKSRLGLMEYLVQINGECLTEVEALALRGLKRAADLGVEQIPYPNGKPLNIGPNFYYPNGKPLNIGPNFYYPNGKPLNIGPNFYYPNGKPLNIGPNFYYPNGSLAGSEGSLLASILGRLDLDAEGFNDLQDESRMLRLIELCWGEHRK